MPHAMTYATVVAVSIVGAGVGVFMGRAAISEINPIYYQALPSTRFFSDLSPAASHSDTWSTEVPAEYWTNDLNVGGRPYCNECSSDFVERDFAEIAAAAASPRYMDEDPAPSTAAPRYAEVSSTGEEADRTVDGFPEEQVDAAPDEEGGPVGM